jgi:hypothetical protein
MRHFVFFVVIAIATSPSIADQQQKPATEEKQAAQNAVPQTSPVTLVVNQATSNEKTQSTDTKPKNRPPIYSNWALVIVAGIAAFAGFKNLGELRKQSALMTRSVEATEANVILQKIAQRQWVDTRNFAISTPYEDAPKLAQITFKVTNPTRAPIRLWLIRITSVEGESNAQGFPGNTLLTPGHPYTFSGAVSLNEAQFASFKSPVGLILTIRVSIIYIDALQDSWEQKSIVTLQQGPSTMGHTKASDYFHTLHDVKLPTNPTETEH